jgi:hypothetical protein
MNFDSWRTFPRSSSILSILLEFSFTGKIAGIVSNPTI